MTHLLIRHKVRDFAKWKVEFDSHAAERTSLGCLGGTLYRTISDPNDIAIVFAWQDAAGAKRYVESTVLRKSMQSGGVINPPELRFLDSVESFV